MRQHIVALYLRPNECHCAVSMTGAALRDRLVFVPIGVTHIWHLIRSPRRLVKAVYLRLRTLFALLTARRRSRRNIRQSAPRRILVVCYGNIYRSAFVGEFLRARLGSDFDVRSCGFHPVQGRSSPQRHVQMCERYSVSLTRHRSAIITAQDLDWADLILLMDRHNWAALFAMGADTRKLVWLGGVLPGTVEIPDPYNLSDDAAERVVQRMHEASGSLAKLLTSRA